MYYVVKYLRNGGIAVWVKAWIPAQTTRIVQVKGDIWGCFFELPETPDKRGAHTAFQVEETKRYWSFQELKNVDVEENHFIKK